MPVELTLHPTVRGALRIYPVNFALAFGVDAFVTDRSGGVSEAPYDSLNLAFHVGDDPERVRENRRRVAQAAGVDFENLVTVGQVHGERVLDIEEPIGYVEADGLVTSASDLALAILVADCVPVLLVDESSPRFAVVHAGWRGLRSGVLRNAVTRFENANTLHAFVGPCISQSRYQVGPEVAEHFTAIPGALVAESGDRSRLNMPTVAVHQLSNLGLHHGHIMFSHESTDGGAPFFSDRAARPCGRFALVAKRSS